MFKSVLFLGRKDCRYSKRLHNLLKKNSLKLTYYESYRGSKKFKDNKKKFDYLFSFRSYEIIKIKTLKKIKFLAINFHPGTPKYRGIGCINFAIYNNEKNYGATAHLIDTKIDHGKIIDLIKFKIKKNDNLDNLLKKTHEKMYFLAERVIKNLIKNQKFYSNKKRYVWSKKLWTKKDLNNLYEIKLTDKKNIVKKKIKATYCKKFKPYIRYENNFITLQK